MFYIPTWTGPWGYLPLAAPLAAVIPARLGARIAPTLGPLAQRMYGATALLALGTIFLRIAASAKGLLSPYAVFALLAALFVTGRPARNVALRDRRLYPIAIVATLAVSLCALVAYLLPVWPWDSLGYHLPYVDFVLSGGLASIPRDVPYLATYPHDVELFFVALRMLLPDDRLVDLGQLPFGLLGALATCGIARRLDATPFTSIIAALLWLTMPAVLLQLATNYVDVAAAAYLLCAIYFLLEPSSGLSQLFTGLALGLFLGSKPSAPVGTALCGIVLLWRGRKHVGATAIACVAIAALGAEAYIVNLVRHHNPVWPVIVHVGPWTLPGVNTVEDLLTSGQGAPHLVGRFRMLRSWLTLVPPASFDMRMGGFGLPFLLAFVPAIVLLWTRRRSLLVLLVLATALAPDPAIARYTLALPGLVLALGAAGIAVMRLEAVRGMPWALGAVAAFNVLVAWPGFVGEGPPLGSYFLLSPSARELAVGPDFQTAAIRQVRDRLLPGEVAAYDRSFEFPHLLWRSDLGSRVIRIDNDLDPAQRDAVLEHDHVKLVVLDDRQRLDPRAWARLFHCETDSCVVYRRR